MPDLLLMLTLSFIVVLLVALILLIGLVLMLCQDRGADLIEYCQTWWHRRHP